MPLPVLMPHRGSLSAAYLIDPSDIDQRSTGGVRASIRFRWTWFRNDGGCELSGATRSTARPVETRPGRRRPESHSIEANE